MKNFKKVLALVLVLATLLGLATMAGAATEYKDADKINADYTEAIKVLDLIETMQGYPDGNFKPTATITREEAAKVIAIFDNKSSDISTYYTSINPFADEKGRWGESYVGYGYRAGIIAGMNATTYAPTANVTGTQFLKMALVTLGYDQEKEGFVGASWAVNVLALAKKIGLIDDLADGWKPEHDLTREEAAQILLNALNTSTVEYGQEAKLANFKPTKVLLKDTWVKNPDGTYSLVADADYSFNGRFYVTVAGAVKTGHPLYEEFDLKKTNSTDAFYRPYTKWTKDKTSVEIMKEPKATFTTKFSACDLLVALGVKEDDTKTKIRIDAVYCDGDDTVSFEDHAIFKEGNGTVTVNAGEEDTVVAATWQHGLSTCYAAKNAKHGAQGTLTQVFYNGKDADGNKHYTITSIETWLGKVNKVSEKTTALDKHLKSKGNVEVYAYFNDMQKKLDENNFDYCGDTYTNDGVDGHTDHCDQVIAIAGENNKTKDGSYKLTYTGETNGLKKGDYVLLTYSFRTEDGWNATTKRYNTYTDNGVQTLDLTEGKAGRLSGHKFGTVASDPSQTRIDSEFVKDSQHFHFGYDDSKTDAYGTYTFYYDAYGNVIGMDGTDSSTWAVIDNAYMTFPKGVDTLNVAVVDLDAKTTESTAKKFASIDEYYGNIHTLTGLEQDVDFTGFDFDFVSAKDFAHTLAVALKNLTNGESNKDFKTIYDHLFKVTTDSEGVYTIKVGTIDNPAGAGKINAAFSFGVHPYDFDATTDSLTNNTIKVVNGKPYLEITDTNYTGQKDAVILTSNTKFLVHKMDGTYASYTGYKNVPSMIAHYAEVVFTEENNKTVADVVYLTHDVYMTDGKVMAYVPGGADMNGIEVKVDGDTYYGLKVYVNGEESEVYLSEEDMFTYFDEKKAATSKFQKGFYELQYTDVNDITTAKVLKGPNGTKLAADDLLVDEYLNKAYKINYFNGTIIELPIKAADTSNNTYATYVLADDCALYKIYKGEVSKTEASVIERLYDDFDFQTDLTVAEQAKLDGTEHFAYVELNDKDEVTAIYFVMAPND